MFLEQSLPRICLPGETRGYFSFILLREISIHVQHVSNALDTIVFSFQTEYLLLPLIHKFKIFLSIS